MDDTNNAYNILSTISAFLETCPDIPEDVAVVVGAVEQEGDGPHTQQVAIGEEKYLVTVTRVA